MRSVDTAFLRDIGLPPTSLDVLACDERVTITGPVLASWLRVAWVAGRKSARDPYLWRTVAELMDDPDAP